MFGLTSAATDKTEIAFTLFQLYCGLNILLNLKKIQSSVTFLKKHISSLF